MESCLFQYEGGNHPGIPENPLHRWLYVLIWALRPQPPAVCSSENFTHPSYVGIYFQGIEGVITVSVIPPSQLLP